MALCELQQVNKIYGEGAAKVQALADLSLAIEPGEFTVFSGPSGSGKTTLLNIVGLLDEATSGKVVLEGQDISGLSGNALAAVRAKRIGFIFQSFNLIPVLSARENVELALQLSGDNTDMRARATQMLKDVGLGEYTERRPNQLSGGQQQRVAIARALVKQPALVIADEPTANLDSTNGAAVLDIMRRMNEERGITFIFSTHDPMVMERARRIVRLHDGKLSGDERRGEA
jgi:putative ABC transport system ATP-binding protein